MPAPSRVRSPTEVPLPGRPWCSTCSSPASFGYPATRRPQGQPSGPRSTLTFKTCRLAPRSIPGRCWPDPSSAQPTLGRCRRATRVRGVLAPERVVAWRIALAREEVEATGVAVHIHLLRKGWAFTPCTGPSALARGDVEPATGALPEALPARHQVLLPSAHPPRDERASDRGERPALSGSEARQLAHTERCPDAVQLPDRRGNRSRHRMPGTTIIGHRPVAARDRRGALSHGVPHPRLGPRLHASRFAEADRSLGGRSVSRLAGDQGERASTIQACVVALRSRQPMSSRPFFLSRGGGTRTRDLVLPKHAR